MRRKYLRVSLPRRLRYAIERWTGSGRGDRDLSILCRRFGVTDARQLFDTARFLNDGGFRSDIPFHFANHHEAHALAALFYTDWNEALIYTSDGIGDNVSYSMRTLKDGRLECYYGDERWFTQRLNDTGLASAYGYATTACGFRMLRHEGKLTGLAAYGTPKLADEMAAQFRFNDRDGLIETDFRDWTAMQEKILAICQGHDRETIAASIQKVAEDFSVQSVRWWLKRTGARKLALAGGLFANVRLNRLLAETLPVDEVFVFPAMGDDGLPVGAALSLLHKRDGTPAWLTHRHRLDDVYLGQDFGDRIDDMLAEAGMRRLPGAPVETAVELIRSGKAGAIYTGRMEFGPRALGARSIIASPHDHAINDDLNKRLARSEFMPFAPYVLEEDAEPRVRDHQRQPLRGALHDDHLRGQAGMARRASRRWCMSTAPRGRRSCATRPTRCSPASCAVPRHDRAAGADQHQLQRARGADRQPAGRMPASAAGQPRRFRRDAAGGLCRCRHRPRRMKAIFPDHMEERLKEEFFRGARKGFFVDVGANDRRTARRPGASSSAAGTACWSSRSTTSPSACGRAVAPRSMRWPARRRKIPASR